jgi:hypothetical protein
MRIPEGLAAAPANHKKRRITMNFKIRANTIKSVLFATVLLATCFSASPANAQSLFRGNFTLSNETNWSGVVLPAGEYVITLDRGTGFGPATALIRNAVTGKVVGMVLSPVADSSADGTDSLLTASRGNRWVVQSFRVTELGKVFIYDRARAKGRRTEEASKTEMVPVLQAKK